MRSPDPTPLAQRLREVAHKADVETHNRAILKVIGKRMSREEKAVVVSWARSTSVVVAVLREIADDCTDQSGKRFVVNPVRLRALADSIEKGAE